MTKIDKRLEILDQILGYGGFAVLLLILLFSLVGCKADDTSIEVCQSGSCDEYEPPTEGDPNGPPKIEKTYPSARGRYKIQYKSQILFPESHEFEAVTSRNGKMYFHLIYEHGPNIKYHRVYQWYDDTNELELQCSWIQDSARLNSLATDGVYFYFKTSSSTVTFRRFRVDNCQEVTAITTGIYHSSYNGHHVQIWPDSNADEVTFLYGSKFGLVGKTTGVLDGTIEQLQYGSATVGFNGIRAFTVDDEIWLVSYYRLWNFDYKWETPNYANLPVSEYQDFYGIKGLARRSATKLYVFHGNSSEDDRIGFASLDVGEF